MKKPSFAAQRRDVPLRPALTPLEAAMIPAKARRGMGALRMARDAFDPWRDARRGKENQRAKI